MHSASGASGAVDVYVWRGSQKKVLAIPRGGNDSDVEWEVFKVIELSTPK